MNRGYVRAHLERAEEGRPLRFIAATEGRKGDGIDLRMDGGRLERYRSNPIVGYGHSYWGRNSLPIGRATAAEVDGDRRLMIDVEFDAEDEFAREVERKYRAGFMSAVSIGFEVLEWESEDDNYWRGGVATDWELIELSAVPIPMDAGAVVAGGRAARDGFAALLDLLPSDPAVRVERDAASLTRSVRVTEEAIRQADPFMLAAHIGRALAAVEDATILPAPPPNEEPEVPDPDGKPEGDESTEEAPLEHGLGRGEIALLHERIASLYQEVADLKRAREPVEDENAVTPEDAERLLAALGS